MKSAQAGITVLLFFFFLNPLKSQVYYAKDSIVLKNGHHLTGYIFEQVPGEYIKVLDQNEKDTLTIPLTDITKYVKQFEPLPLTLNSKKAEKIKKVKQKKDLHVFKNFKNFYINNQFSASLQLESLNFLGGGLDIFNGFEKQSIFGIGGGISAKLSPRIDIETNYIKFRTVKNTDPVKKFSIVQQALAIQSSYRLTDSSKMVQSRFLLGFGHLFNKSVLIDRSYDDIDNAPYYHNFQNSVFIRTGLRITFNTSLNYPKRFFIEPNISYTKPKTYTFDHRAVFQEYGIYSHELVNIIKYSNESLINTFNPNLFFFSLKFGVSF